MTTPNERVITDSERATWGEVGRLQRFYGAVNWINVPAHIRQFMLDEIPQIESEERERQRQASATEQARQASACMGKRTPEIKEAANVKG